MIFESKQNMGETEKNKQERSVVGVDFHTALTGRYFFRLKVDIEVHHSFVINRKNWGSGYPS